MYRSPYSRHYGLYKTDLGDLLCEAIAKTNQLMVIAPFIKESALAALLKDFHGEDLIVITRANPQDFAKGVSDLSAWKLIWERGGEVRRIDSLHAKIIRTDYHFFIGSANITNKALSWTTNANLEALIEIPGSSTTDQFCNEIWEDSILVTEKDYDDLSVKVTNYLNDPEVIQLQQALQRKQINKLSNRQKTKKPSQWLPQCLNPAETLWATYLCVDNDETAYEIIDALSLPRNLQTEDELKRAIAHKINGCDFEARIDNLFNLQSRPERPFLSFGTIKHQSGIAFENSDQINGVISLLVYALPNKYFEEPPHSYTRLIGKY